MEATSHWRCNTEERITATTRGNHRAQRVVADPLVCEQIGYSAGTVHTWSTRICSALHVLHRLPNNSYAVRSHKFAEHV